MKDTRIAHQSPNISSGLSFFLRRWDVPWNRTLHGSHGSGTRGRKVGWSGRREMAAAKTEMCGDKSRRQVEKGTRFKKGHMNDPPPVVSQWGMTDNPVSLQLPSVFLPRTWKKKKNHPSLLLSLTFLSFFFLSWFLETASDSWKRLFSAAADFLETAWIKSSKTLKKDNHSNLKKKTGCERLEPALEIEFRIIFFLK